MEKLAKIISFIALNWKVLMKAIATLIAAIGTILLLIPGNQGEAILSSIELFLQKLIQ